MRISTQHGKTEGLQAVNTSPLDNHFCTRLACNPDTICAKCYAARLCAFRKGARTAFAANGELLTLPLTVGYLEQQAKRFDPASGFVRYNAFGELLDARHALNLFIMAGFRPDLQFALWTKRPRLVKGLIKPRNLQLIYSEPLVNGRPILPSGFDKTFTVHDRKSDAEINCGQKKCKDCRWCYDGTGPVHINERVK